MTTRRTVAGASFVIVGLLLYLGLQLLVEPHGVQSNTEQLQAVPAEQVTAGNSFADPAAAAVAKALQVGIREPQADKFVLIFADDQMVDLRVRVDGTDCAWFGVTGLVQDDKIEWSNAGSGDGQPCG